jgi:tryptophan 6-halogenase
VTRPPGHVVVLGGGTAGWIAACLIAHRWGAAGTRVTVIESPDIGIIGVGEGSTPQLKALFETLGIDESDWMPACNATYKTGISFHGWSSRPGFARYFHPFQTALDSHTAPQFFFNTRARRTGRDVPAHPDSFFLPARLAASHRAPLAPPNFPFEIGYGYHFDATLVGQFLRAHAIKTLGVTHLPRTVRDVVLDTQGGVAHLVIDDGETVAGAFFVDASGFRATIIQAALGEPFRPFAENLFNDRAVALPTPNSPGPLSCETQATALSAGWTWRIPLTNRAGNGYVYSSAHLSEEQAERELRAHLGIGDDAPSARHLTMKVGRVERSWVHNCLAVGLSQGFIEPLEATALHIVQATVEGFLDTIDLQGSTADFNTRIAARYEGIRDYIVAHYRFNSRTDTDYWRANAAQQNLSESLRGLMTAWFAGADLVEEIARQGIAKYYAPLSWHCLMAGYGAFPDTQKMRPPEAGLPVADMARIERFIDGCAANFPYHGNALAALIRE